MDKIDFRIHANFMGEDVILAPSNQNNRTALQKAYNELNDLSDLNEWYKKQEAKIKEDKRLNDDTKAKKLEKLDKEFTEKSKKFSGKLPEHRKKVCNIMIGEWKDGAPDEEFYSNDYFDDYALGRLLGFFLNPKGLTPSESQLNGSGS